MNRPNPCGSGVNDSFTVLSSLSTCLIKASFVLLYRFGIAYLDHIYPKGVTEMETPYDKPHLHYGSLSIITVMPRLEPELPFW